MTSSVKKYAYGLVILMMCAMFGGLFFLRENEERRVVFSGNETYKEEFGFRVGTMSTDETFVLPFSQTADASGQVERVYDDEEVFVSDWLLARVPFHALGIEWDENVPTGTKSELYVRTRKADGGNSEWIRVTHEIDMDAKGAGRSYSLIRTAWSTKVQYKIVLATSQSSATPQIKNVEFTYIDSTDAVSQPEQSIATLEARIIGADDSTRFDTPSALEKAAFKISPDRDHIPVISREMWGANESLRMFEGQGKPVVQEVDKEISEKYADEIALGKTVKKDESGRLLKWPLEYPKLPIKALIIHHTASQEDAITDTYAAMRAIYYYHTVSRGWGDIGYNYLIDEYGNVFEGRYGGDTVVGAHTADFNVGSVGVAIIGNYEENEVKFDAVRSLIHLLTDLSEKYNLDPEDIVSMRGENLYVISGHSDAQSTACPGKYLYEKLASVRQLIKAELEGRRSKTDIEKGVREASAGASLDFLQVGDQSIVSLNPEETKTVQVKLKNTGTKTWSRSTALVYKNGEKNVAQFDTVVGRQKEVRIEPGQTATFDIAMNGTLVSGLKNYYLYLENDEVMSENRLLFPVYMEPAIVAFELVKMEKSPASVLRKKQSTVAEIRLKNNGNLTWRKGAMEVMSMSTENIFLESGEMVTETVVPGQEGVFKMTFKAGDTTGDFVEKVKIVMRGESRSGSVVRSKSTQEFSFRVNGPATSGVSILSHSSDQNFLPKETRRVWVELQNNSEETWKRVGKDRLVITFLKSPTIGVKNQLMEKPQVFRNGKTKVSFDLTSPEKPGAYFVNLVLRNNGKRLSKLPLRFEFTTVEEGAGTSVPDPESSSVSLGQNIRIKLSFSGDPILTADSAMEIFDAAGTHLNNGKKLRKGEQIYVSYDGGNYSVRMGEKVVTTAYPVRIKSDGGVMRIANFEHRPAWNASLNDNEYRGVIEVRYVPEEKVGEKAPAKAGLAVINELPLEHYVRGIAEVSNTDPYEKVKAMMVLARTYAYFYMTQGQKFPGMPYQLDDDPEVSQKYLGYGFEKRAPEIVRAAADTQGMMVTYEGNVVKTPYFSSTDGTATKSANEVWGWTDTPYLISVPDPLCESIAFSGHGVGLSGCGAAEAARRGYVFEDIIKYYYKGVELKKVY